MLQLAEDIEAVTLVGSFSIKKYMNIVFNKTLNINEIEYKVVNSLYSHIHREQYKRQWYLKKT